MNTVVIDGHSIGQIVEGLQAAKAEITKPTAILCKTEKGKGYGESIEGKLNWHGKDLGAEIDKSIELVKSHMKKEAGSVEYKTFPPEGDDVVSEPVNISITPTYNIETDIISTRKAYGNGLLKAREADSRVVALDGDTKGSTFAITLENKFPESFVECYIAEQNMVGVA